ncbi:hypothetical protein D3C73_1313860 [compost metagenome]
MALITGASSGLGAEFGQVEVGQLVVVHGQSPAHEHGAQGWASTACHRADRRVVQAEVARLVQAVDRQVGRHAHLQAADGVQT